LFYFDLIKCMNILFLSDNFPPEYNAPASRTYEHCREWVRLGARVTVITCAPNFPKGEVFPGYDNKWKQVDYVDGIKVIRVWSFISPNKGLFKRTLDFVSFAITSFIAGISVKCDIIVATSPQFFAAVSGCLLGMIKRKSWVMEVRDLWPESILAVEAVQIPWVISLLEKIELFLYRKAKKIIVVTESFKKSICARGINPDKIFIVKNGVDISTYLPQEKNAKLRQQLSINDKFVVGYLGTHGLAHSLDFIIKSISSIKDNSFHFLFIGDGAVKKNIVQLSHDLQLTNVTFVDAVSKNEIPSYLAALDVSLVPLKKSPTFESVIPSKIFESAAMNIPILLGVNGETREIIEYYGAGLYFEPENEVDFVNKLKLIRNEIESGNTFEGGCQKLASEFDRKQLAKRMLQILSQPETASK